jgi:hypothetical protein
LKSTSSVSKIITLLLLFASVAALPFAFPETAIAHGPPPSGCALYHGIEYQSDITSFVVDMGQRQYDVIENPGVTIPVTRDQQFRVQFTLHSDREGFRMDNGSRIEVNSSNDEGYAWYRDFANGYPYSKCAGPLHGDADFELSQNYTVSHMFQGEGPHKVFFETSLDDSKPKAEFYLLVVDDLTELEPEDRDSEIADGKPDYNDETILAPFVLQSDNTEIESSDAGFTGDLLTINGTIASLAYANQSAGSAPDIISGEWVVTVNNTAVSDFHANITVVNADGLGRMNYQIANFTAVNSSSVSFGANLVSIASSSTVLSRDSGQDVNMVITLERLNAMRLDLDEVGGIGSGPIYGIVDKLTISQIGKEDQVIQR